MICTVPVAVYPKTVIDELQSELSQLKATIQSGKQPAFDSIDELIDKLENG